MFRVATLKDIVQLKPKRFGENRVDALTHEINKKYANKVIYKLGLAICLFDIVEIKEAHVFPGDGSAHFYVQFRLVVFRPFTGEVLKGAIESSTADHIKVSLKFFRDIYIPAHAMREGVVFDDGLQEWIWQYQDEDGASHQLKLAKGCEITFKVMEETFHDVIPVSEHKKQTTPDGLMVKKIEELPYVIMGQITEDGLGMSEWWEL